MAEFMPLKRESFVFHHSTLDPPPSIRRLGVNGDESKDYLSQYAYLSIKSSGGYQVYAVRGFETRRGSASDGEDSMTGRAGANPIKLEWRFEYVVEDKRKADGTKAGGGEKFLTPLRFSCSPGLLHSRQARKVTVLGMWKKTIQPRIVASKLEPLSPTSPTSPTHRVVSPLSSPTSPKGGVGVSALRFPSASKLWGKRTKNSPYRFDKGSDGSEEELLPLSEDSANRRRRRPNSACFSRAPQLQQRWEGDRGQTQSTDAVFQTNSRSTRPATAGGLGEGTKGRNRGFSFGRGAASEGESERVFSRLQGDISGTVRYGYGRRPRTAR